MNMNATILFLFTLTTWNSWEGVVRDASTSHGSTQQDKRDRTRTLYAVVNVFHITHTNMELGSPKITWTEFP